MSKSTKWTQKQVEEVLAKRGIVNNPVKNIPNIIPASYALGRMKAGKMNKTEKAYADLLDVKKQVGEVLWWEFEPVNLRIAEKCFYAVDFMVMLSSGQLECHEIKGFWTDDALVKIKAAAAKFPFKFISFQLIKGEWKSREF